MIPFGRINMHYILVAILCSTVGATIWIDDGTLKINGYNKCHLDVNGNSETITLNGSSYARPGLTFGLIKWKCDGDYGNIIQDIECRKCGVYCSYNQQFEKCKTPNAVLILGLVLGVAMFVISVLMSLICCRGKIDDLYFKVFHHYLTANDRARAKKIIKLNKITGANHNILFRLIVTKDEKLNKMIMESRMALRKEINGDEPIYEEICQKEYAANKFSADLENRVINSSHHRMGYNAAKAAIVTGLLLSSAPAPTYSCDTTLYLQSSGKVCDDKSCQDTKAYSIPIETGSRLCFNTADGERLEMKIKDSKAVTRYQAMYYACSYSIITDNYWECKSPYSQCWNKGSCVAGGTHEGLNKTVKSKERSNILPHGYGCNSDTVGCDTMCWHETSCTWYRWQIKIKDRSCYKVYQKVSEVWQTSVFINYKGVSKHIKLNTNNPTYNLKSVNKTGIIDLPMLITSFSYESLHLRDSIITIGSDSYSVDASQQNFPIKNTVGEMQMSLDQQSFVYHTSMPFCKPESCNTVCVHDTPSVDRIATTKSALISPGQVFKNGEMILKRQIPIQATANLVLGSIELDHLFVSPSRCKLSVEQSYACTGCEIKPYVIIRAYDIKTEGLLEFESNCTWAKKTLSCNPEPYMMSVEQDSDYCQIFIPSTNQTLFIPFEYMFIGQLSMLRTYYSESAITIS